MRMTTQMLYVTATLVITSHASGCGSPKRPRDDRDQFGRPSKRFRRETRDWKCASCGQDNSFWMTTCESDGGCGEPKGYSGGLPDFGHAHSALLRKEREKQLQKRRQDPEEAMPDAPEENEPWRTWSGGAPVHIHSEYPRDPRLAAPQPHGRPSPPRDIGHHSQLSGNPSLQLDFRLLGLDSKTNPPQPSRDMTRWTCSFCTFANQPSASVCDMCMRPPQTASVLDAEEHKEYEDAPASGSRSPRPAPTDDIMDEYYLRMAMMESERAAKRQHLGKPKPPVVVPPSHGKGIYLDHPHPDYRRSRYQNVRNVGNSCWMSSLIQVLIHLGCFSMTEHDELEQHVKHVREHVLGRTKRRISTRTEPDFCQKEMDAICELVRKTGGLEKGQQHDPAEALGVIHDMSPKHNGWVNAYGKRMKVIKRSIVRHLVAKTSHERSCVDKSCLGNVRHEEDCLAIPLAIPDITIPWTCQMCTFKNEAFHQQCQICGLSRLSMQAMLHAAFKEETVDLTCGVGDCRSLKAKKVMIFQTEETPNILCLQLKRFDNCGNKIQTKLDIEQKLSWSPNSIHDPIEGELVAIIRHHGATIHGGHYTAVIQKEDGKWWEFDDGACWLDHDIPPVPATLEWNQILENRSHRMTHGDAHPYLLFYRVKSSEY